MDRGKRGSKTLTKVFLYLDSVIVDRNFLTGDEGALVGGLLEGHTELFTFAEKRESGFRNPASTTWQSAYRSSQLLTRTYTWLTSDYH